MRHVYSILHIKTKRDYPLPCRKYREAGKIKTEVIANLSKFLSEVVLTIKGVLHKDKNVLVSLKDIVITKSIDFCFVYVLIMLMKRLRISKVLEKVLGEKEQLAFKDVEEELKMIKLNILKIGKNHEEIKITEPSARQREIFKNLEINYEELNDM